MNGDKLQTRPGQEKSTITTVISTANTNTAANDKLHKHSKQGINLLKGN